MIIKCIFPEHLIQEPIINQLGNEFDIVTSIKQAKVTSDVGWVVLDVSGEELEIQKSIVWLAEKGIGIQLVEDGVK